MQDLFAAIGTSFGTGDGSSNFNVPDLRDRVPLGFGTNMSSMGAATTGIAASASGGYQLVQVQQDYNTICINFIRNFCNIS